MDRPNDYPSGTRLATANQELAWFETSLAQAQACVARMEPSPTTTRLGLALEVLKGTMASWSETPPTEEQRWLFREHLTEVLDLARGSAPTVRPLGAKRSA
ncbi:MAG: hypothetical protein ACRENE_19360 [Polyangiaceae bacterium]